MPASEGLFDCRGSASELDRAATAVAGPVPVILVSPEVGAAASVHALAPAQGDYTAAPGANSFVRCGIRSRYRPLAVRVLGDFHRSCFPLVLPHLTPVYGRLPLFVASRLPGNTPTLFIDFQRNKENDNEKEAVTSWPVPLAVVQRLRYSDTLLGAGDGPLPRSIC